MPGAGIYKQAIALAVQQLCLVRFLQTSCCLGSSTAMPGTGIYKQAIALAVQQLCLVRFLQTSCCLGSSTAIPGTVFTNKLLPRQFNSCAWYGFYKQAVA